MATPPRPTQRDTIARNMSTRTLVVAVAVLLIGGFLLYKGLNRSTKLSTGDSAGAAKPPVTVKGATTLAPGATTVAPAIVATTLAPINSRIDIMVANGAEIQGIAGRVGTSLQTKGYLVLPAVTALKAEATGGVYYKDQNQKLAQLVAADLGIAKVDVMPATLNLKDGKLGTAGILVMLGKDFNEKNIPAASALKAAGGGGAATPAATVAPAVTAAPAPAPAKTDPATTAKKA